MFVAIYHPFGSGLFMRWIGKQRHQRGDYTEIIIVSCLVLNKYLSRIRFAEFSLSDDRIYNWILYFNSGIECNSLRWGAAVCGGFRARDWLRVCLEMIECRMDDYLASGFVCFGSDCEPRKAKGQHWMECRKLARIKPYLLNYFLHNLKLSLNEWNERASDSFDHLKRFSFDPLLFSTSTYSLKPSSIKEKIIYKSLFQSTYLIRLISDPKIAFNTNIIMAWTWLSAADTTGILSNSIRNSM